MTGAELRSTMIQGAFVGAAAGNVAVAPFIGQGSVVWFVLVFLMFVTASMALASFKRVLVLALLSLPVLYIWQLLHRLELGVSFLVVQFGYMILSSQAACGCVLWYQKLRDR